MQARHPSRRVRRALIAASIAVSGIAGAAGITPAPASAITAPVTTVGTIAASKASYLRGEKVTITAAMPTRAATAKATGTVSFVVNGAAPVVVALNSGGKAVLASTAYTVGSYHVTGTYSGDAKYAAGSVGALSFSVAKGSTTTTIASKREPVALGTKAYFTARAVAVAPAKGSTGGTVTFSADDGDGSPITGTVTATSAGGATWLPLLPQGRYQVTATHNGNTDFMGSSSAPVAVTVGNPPPPNQVPVAVAAATPNSGKSPLAVAFSSAGSSDPDGTIVAYSWNFGDGSPVVIDANPTHTYTSPATYVATLTVTDDDGATDTATTTVTVVANQAPVAAASATPTKGKAPVLVEFSSAGSADPDGNVAAYSWNFGDGSPTNGSPAPSHTYVTPGTYTAVLTVTDDSGATDTAEVTIAAGANHPPIAAASALPTDGTAPLKVYFSSTGSADPDGTLVSYAWDFGDGSTATGPSPDHEYQEPGTYIATLTVTDDNDATATTTVPVVVAEPAPNQLPNAVAWADSRELTVSFDGSHSTDADGSIASYLWEFGDESSASGVSPIHTYEVEGAYEVRLTVTDDADGKDTEAFIITLVTNQAPTARAYVAPEGHAPVTAVFDGSASTDPDGTIVEYLWDFGDGHFASGRVVYHTYSVAGIYNPVLTVTDDDGGTDTFTTVFYVLPPNLAPTAAADWPSSVTPGDQADFSALRSSDPDGYIVDYFWDFGDGSGGGGIYPGHTYDAEGSYLVSLTVIDDAGATDTVYGWVLVEWPNGAPVADGYRSVSASVGEQTYFDASPSSDGTALLPGGGAPGHLPRLRFCRSYGTCSMDVFVTSDHPEPLAL